MAEECTFKRKPHLRNIFIQKTEARDFLRVNIHHNLCLVKKKGGGVGGNRLTDVYQDLSSCKTSLHVLFRSKLSLKICPSLRHSI